jgi:pimeloyl-ACP methyl ester carboxylesterase
VAAALARSPRMHTATIDGATVAYRSWEVDPAAGRDVLLLHGGAAHSGWWDPIAPLLDVRRVIAPDLWGHGDSAHREEYSLELWADQLLTVAAETGIAARTVVGHSLGGLIATALACRPDSPIEELVVVDSPLGGRGTGPMPESAELAARRPRVYPTERDALDHFRPVPPQAMIPLVGDHIAGQSLRRTAEGWVWKYDGRIFVPTSGFRADPHGIRARLGYIRAEFGLIPEPMEDFVRSAGGTAVMLPRAGHAPMLDRPLAFAEAIADLLA